MLNHLFYWINKTDVFRGKREHKLIKRNVRNIYDCFSVNVLSLFIITDAADDLV
jgi:hypothetical protein